MLVVEDDVEVIIGDCRGDFCGCFDKYLVINGGSRGVVVRVWFFLRFIFFLVVIFVFLEICLFIIFGLGKYEVGCGVVVVELLNE